MAARERRAVVEGVWTGESDLSDGSTADPKFWRRRAKEARFQADRTSDAETKRALLSIAETYERLAEQAQNRPDQRRH